MAGLCLGAIVQPLVTAAIFTCELSFLYTLFDWSKASSFEFLFRVVMVYSLVVSVPLALLYCLFAAAILGNKLIGDHRRIDQHLRDFSLFVAAGGISIVCATIAVCVYVFQTP